jgi:DNA helicase-2/ATP-dependent DNA helicase PcrA
VISSEFNKRYKKLNNEQKSAVDYIDGPLLVLAGPGTGKTELLSVRVANILDKTDTLPQNILCLTFTDAAARNMQDRLRTIIEDAAYDVQINTYHSFASDIILSNPEFFKTIDVITGKDYRMERPIDDIRQTEIMTQILTDIDFDNPLKGEYYLNSLLSIISDSKQANIDPNSLKEIATKNLSEIEKVNDKLKLIFTDIKSLPRKVNESIKLFNSIQDLLSSIRGNLTDIANDELTNSIKLAEIEESTKPLTVWKNKWLKKNSDNTWVFDDIDKNQKIIHAADIYEIYQNKLIENNEYDFNDMILRTIQAMESNPELKFNLQEKYLYILLDEFQDTNAAQFKLMSLIADSPVNEGRPNIMAVGDDDQGIFAFQGANINNMLSFVNIFKDVEIVSLEKNYRSHHDIIFTAHNVAKQIEDRLHTKIDNITKEIVAANDSLPVNAHINRHEFDSEANEMGWISDKVKSLIESGVKPNEISVISPKHKILESLVPFINQKDVPVSYEKRENIIDTKIVDSLYKIAKVVIAIKDNNLTLLDELFPQILSLNFWNISPVEIYKTNWQFSKEKFSNYRPWVEIALENKYLEQSVKSLLNITSYAQNEGLEKALDIITGTIEIEINNEYYRSPIYQYYFSENQFNNNPLEFYEALSHLTVIRSHLREMSRSVDTSLQLIDFVYFIDTYKKSNKSLVNTHPIVQNENSVKLQTVYKSKGLEYEHVFLPSMNDDIWGKSARSNNDKISLPENLKHIKHLADTEDTKRRLLFVALTRAKQGLYITNYLSKENGKKSSPVKYMIETENINGKWSEVLPKNNNKVTLIKSDEEQKWINIRNYWFTDQLTIGPNLKSLIVEKLDKFVLSPTNLNNFTNLEYAGPQHFMIHNLLKFPEAPTPSGIYGDAVHKSLEFYQKNHSTNDNECVSYFESLITNNYLINDKEKFQYLKKGKNSLNKYLETKGKWLKSDSLTEVDFRSESVQINNVRLTGKLDRIEVNKKNKSINIIDFKTGKPITSWDYSSKCMNYKQQLYFYKLLVENSRTYKGYTVDKLSLEFVEPDTNGKIRDGLDLKFNDKEYQEFIKLIEAVWALIINLNIPDVSIYQSTISGSKMFIKDLLYK